jgi:NAD(P)-dependent dehydrogenase (short-subunit alcohol dehydrogenase family)
MGELEGRVAVVTGGAGGLGSATATVLAQNGAHVVVAGHSQATAEVVAREIRAAGSQAVAAAFDASQESSIVDLIRETIKEFGRIDILHNNAALTAPNVFVQDNLLGDLDAGVFAQILQVNLIGYALTFKHALPYMLAQGSGVVINTSSFDGIRAPLGRPMYGASKAGVDALTRSIATQYGRYGIRAVGVSPGPIITPNARKVIPQEMLDRLARHLLTRDGVPEDLGHLVAFLASDKAGFITGITVQIDGGMSVHFPDYADELAAL